MENSVILIGNGFLGNRIAWSIRDAKVFHVSHLQPEVDIEILPKAAAYTVVWAHGVSRGTDSEVMSSQLWFMVRMFKMFEAHKVNVVRHILLSSSHVNLESKFGYAKRLCESVLLQEADTSSVDVFILRVPNVYGEVSEEKSNSILSRWLCSDAPIRADATAVVNYVSSQQVADTVVSQLSFKGVCVADLLPGAPLPVRSVASEIADTRGLPLEIAAFAQPASAQTAPLASSMTCVVPPLDISLIPSLVSGCEFAKQLRNRVRHSQRSHNSACGERALLDLEAEDIESAKRVYAFNVAKGTKRGGHYHREQTETFTVIKGACELLIKTANGTTVSVPLSAGQKITVNPGEEHTFWCPTTECMILTTSDMAYIPNSVPDTYVYV